MKIGQRAAVQIVSLDARGRQAKIDLYGEYQGKVGALHAVKPEGTTIVYGTEVFSEWFAVVDTPPPIGMDVETMICDHHGKRLLGMMRQVWATYRLVWKVVGVDNLAEVLPTHWRIREQ